MAGVLNLPTRYKKGDIPYSNRDAIKNGILYTTGTGTREDKKEVIWYRTFGLDTDPQTAISIMEKSQYIFGLAEMGERRAYHILYTFSNWDFHQMGYNLEWIIRCAYYIGQNLYAQGYQNVVAIHDNYIVNGYMEKPGQGSERFHIDVFISNISLETGKRFNYTNDIRTREQVMLQNEVIRIVKACPVYFTNPEIMNQRMYGKSKI